MASAALPSSLRWPYSVGLALGLISCLTGALNAQHVHDAKVLTSDFPKVEVCFHHDAPQALAAGRIQLWEGDSLVAPTLEVSPGSHSGKRSFLFLVENLERPERRKFYLETLEAALSQLQASDQVAIAAFDRKRPDGSVLRYVHSFDEPTAEAAEGLRQLEAVNDLWGKQKSPNLYHAIYEGLLDVHEAGAPEPVVIVLSTGLNIVHSANEVFGCIQLAQKHHIPIYSIRYFVQGYEGHDLSQLCRQTYGREATFRSTSPARDTAVAWMNAMHTRRSGLNYSLQYQSGAKRGEEMVSLTLKVDSEEINLILSPPPLSFLQRYMVFVIAGGAMLLLILVYIIFKLSEGSGSSNQIVHREAALAPPPATLQWQQQSISIPSTGVRMGRAPENDLVLNDGNISRYHSAIFAKDGHWLIRDERSTNGTLVNGQPIQRHVLRDHDQIQIGDTQIRFYLVTNGA